MKKIVYFLLFILFILFQFKNIGNLYASNFQYPDITIEKGWNLVAWCSTDSSPDNITGVSNIKSIWQWDIISWRVWTSDTALKKYLDKYEISPITYIQSYEGVWIFSETDTTIHFNGSFESKKPNIHPGWNLLGWCNNDTLPKDMDGIGSVQTIWKWNDNKWEIWSYKESIMELLNNYKLPIIAKITTGDGFWWNQTITDNESSVTTTYDIEKNGIPKFCDVNYIELDKIAKISKFRSGEGHDYSDDFESCRSMKHYFYPKASVDWGEINIFSPVDGTVSMIYQEWAGTQVQISSTKYPAFTFIIFHINLETPLKVGDKLYKGQLLGNHIGQQTTSDIALGVNTPTGWKLISYFDVMTDSLFEKYKERGMKSRNDAIITKEERDADPISCDGETFLNNGNLENWVILK